MKKLIILCMQLTTLTAAPLLPMHVQMQQQMLALQQLHMLNALGAMDLPIAMKPPPSIVSPLILLLPSIQFPNNVEKMDTIFNSANRIYTKNDLKVKNNKFEENEDSVTINAEEEQTNINRRVLLPNTRGVIGSIISAIPFLPIEVNVPDSIAWIYNGIAGIIAGLGQRFKPRPGMLEDVRIFKQNMQQNVWPIFVVPVNIDAPVIPIQ